MNELTPADLDAWRLERLETGKPATVNRALTYLKAYYNLAIRDEHCGANPVMKLKRLGENNERHRWLQDEEEERLRAGWVNKKGEKVKGMAPADFDLVAFAFETGLRQEEQFELRWERVDVPNKVLKVAESKAGLRPTQTRPPCRCWLASAICTPASRPGSSPAQGIRPSTRTPTTSRNASSKRPSSGWRFMI